MASPIIIVQLAALHGPNIYRPQPGVVLRASAPADHTARLRNALKGGALAIGLVIAHLHVTAQPRANDTLLSAFFTTNEPDIGAELCRYVVDGINAELTGDETWDPDEPLLALRDRRQAQALPVAALQLIAHARQRDIPATILPGGHLLLGYGERSWMVTMADLRAAPNLQPPWSQLGRIPIIAVTGERYRSHAVAEQAARYQARAIDHADRAAVIQALADPTCTALVAGFDTDSLLREGLPFDRCDLAVITDRAGQRPAAALDDDEWLKALGLPMLCSTAPTLINLADPALHALLSYAPNGVMGWGGYATGAV
ncbi:DUF4938 domain-containing protein [Chloroflexus sp.]|uniref:DUF4938 domain-containing protein n=1 Tax=Chloroflexus sp. TaxID=1904827 RepID=UPI00298F2762|nr:DUF4938 domain-containing protein [Chloroflexus sp.]MCS6888351.1 DUF4938 domain-containing protein [Chloroflexus sp.]MDW8402718.1 DUF4938 domain-containing protein [Chloroflexus sp.]